MNKNDLYFKSMLLKLTSVLGFSKLIDGSQDFSLFN